MKVARPSRQTAELRVGTGRRLQSTAPIKAAAPPVPSISFSSQLLGETTTRNKQKYAWIHCELQRGVHHPIIRQANPL